MVAGGLLPVGYQIFRMGYYGLLVPQTALAKDASGDKWAQGFVYLANFNEPYLLWIPALLLVALGAVLVAAPQPAVVDRPVGRPQRLRLAGPPGPEPDRGGDLHARQRSAAGASTGSARAATSCTAGCC